MSIADRIRAERTLRRRIRDRLQVWAEFVLAPSGQIPAKHHVAIMTELEALARGETRRLILLLPPGAAKSTYASKIFPAWWLARYKSSSVIAACHTAGLAAHFGRSVRGLIEAHSARLDVRVRSDARAANRFLTQGGGEYFAVGLHGAVTGRRADLALIDDPIKSFADAESFAAREHLWDWYRSELVTRLKPQGRIVLVMTRWHDDDLAGRLISQGGWKTLCLPALAMGDDALGRMTGEALWPEWEDREAILAKRSVLGDRHFSALFQQAPLRKDGQIFDPAQISFVDLVPRGIAVRAWDLAGTDAAKGDPDWTAGVKLLRDDMGRLFVDDVIRLRGSPGDVVTAIRAAAERDGAQVAVGLPQDPGQAGRAQVMFLTSVLAGFRVVASPETGSKLLRATLVASQVSNGNLSLRRAAWNSAFLDEISTFPNGRKDDQVDALSRAFSMLLETGVPARFASLPFSTR